MYLLFAIIAAVFGASMGSRNLGDIPFSQLTFNMLWNNLLSAVGYIGAVFLGFQSLLHDRIWPWRWTLPYFGNLLVRGTILALVGGVAAFVLEEKYLYGWRFVALLIFSVMFLLYVFFSSDFNVFHEKENIKNSVDQL